MFGHATFRSPCVRPPVASLLGGLLLLGGLAGPAAATVFRVDGYNGNDANGGTNWETDALWTIQGAIGKAANGDEIWVRGATYTPPSQGTWFGIVVNKTLSIYGGFGGGEAERNQRNVRANVTTVQCPWGGGNGHGFYVNPNDPTGTVVIDGFVVNAGWARGSETHGSGGGIYANYCNIVIANCYFYFCYAYWGGGVNIGCNCPSAAVVGCAFQNCDAANYGAGLDTCNTGVVVAGCEFCNNSAWGGGGIAMWYGGTVINCTLTGNQAYEAGGGVLGYQQGTLTVRNSIIWGNKNGFTGAPSEIAVWGSAVADVSYSDIRGGWAGTGNINADPFFVNTGDSGDYRIQPFSPCVDTGLNAALPADMADLNRDGDTVEPLPLDLTGRARLADGDNNGTATVDMGAFEFLPDSETLRTLTVVIDPSPSGSVTGPGIACPGTCTRAYIARSRVTLTATTDANGIFDKWNDWDTDPTYEVRLVDDQTVVAHFMVPVPGPSISVKPPEMDCGDIEPGSGCMGQLWIRNVGTEPLVIGEILPPTAPFQMGTDNCSGATLQIGESCMFEAGFFPEEDDYGVLSSNVEIPSNDPLNNSVVIILRGTVFRDEDGDRVSDMREQGPSGNDAAYDGNGDGIPDWQQGNVVSLPRAEGADTGYVTLAVPATTGDFDYVSTSPVSDWLADPEMPDPPAGVSLLRGVFRFRLELDAGVTAATVTMYLPAGSYPTRYYQYYEEDKGESAAYWYEFNYDGQTGAQMAGRIITLHYIDGQRGDDNTEEADRWIMAEGAPGWLAGDDDDGDGVPSATDNCPFTFNPDQLNSDGDGLGDACDGCPFNPVKTQPGVCGCNFIDADADGDGVYDCQDGCPFDRFKTAPGPCGCGNSDVDRDNDGVPDCLDGCPDDPNKSAPGACGCGNSEADGDGDGVPDCIDNCPAAANADQADGDGDGVGDACDLDLDADGVNAEVEAGAPNNGDGNNDGVPDSEQPNVTSLPNTSGNYLTIAAPAGTELVAVTAIDNPSPGDMPASAQFPAGFLSYAVQGLAPGAEIAVELTVHVPPAEGINSYWKYGPTPDDPTPHWYEFMYDGITGATINGNVITLHFKDGPRGDADLSENGIVTDPGGPAVLAEDSGQTIPTTCLCGTGACGAGVVGYVPVIFLGICGLKLWPWRRVPRPCRP